MKIGFILGTFDPVHIGHIGMAVKCIDEHILDLVYFVPTVQNPWKDKPIAQFKDRCEMIERSIPIMYRTRIMVDTIEYSLFAPYYSSTTLDKLNEKYPNDNLYIISGADIINTLPQWKNYETMIKGRYNVIGFTRSNIEINDTDINYTLVESNVPEISSTKIRNLIKERKCVYPYIHENIIGYAKEIYS